MAIQIGQQLGSLEVTALLGKGGVGEVYRARDTKLKRDVAIKIRPEEFSRHPECVSRFQRERWNFRPTKEGFKMIRKAKTVAITILLVTVCYGQAEGQAAPTTILEIDVADFVVYFGDTSDPSKFATDPNPTTGISRTFGANVGIADIVAVNGEQAMGTFTRNFRGLFLGTAPTPGQAIADTVRGGVFADTFEILKSDGTPIGTIVSYGLSQGSPAPGAPLAVTQGNFAIVGGTGAFLGARGQSGAIPPRTMSQRAASVTEDPANRRRNGGGRTKFVLQVIPMEGPQILSASDIRIPEVGLSLSGTAVFHSDFSPVTAAKPAHGGEIVISLATGMGPTRPGVDPGQPFPTWPDHPLQQINSPVGVRVNGQSADVINAIGWPGLVARYRVDFRVPTGTASGIAAVQLSAAWIQGPTVNLPIQ